MRRREMIHGPSPRTLACEGKATDTAIARVKRVVLDKTIHMGD